MHSKSLALAISLLIAATACAQETILPGDARVDGSIIRAVTNAWKMTGTSPGGQRTDGGVWSDDFVGGMFGLLVAGFPLQRDFTAKFPVFDPRNGVAWATYTVIDRERVRAGKGRTVEAWTVEVQDPVRVARMIFSLTKEPPYIIRLQEAGEGKWWVFDMI